MRHGDIADDPYIHYAASMQKLFEDLALQMMIHCAPAERCATSPP